MADYPFFDYLNEALIGLEARDEARLQAVSESIERTVQALRAGGTLFFCGNGGSASTASHISNDLACHMRNWTRRGYRCVCLNDSPSVMSSLSNDYGFEYVFSKPLEALGKKGDILWGFSTSGNSKNVVKAVETARNMGIETVAFTGDGGGRLKNLADVCVCVHSEDVVHVEELHLIYGHGIAIAVEAALSPTVPKITEE